ncbi:hypothetical protein LUZ60_017717 [Juncus effusus]|nr:hypothetical protein LUZ60_017717 [Juncus effusus]
MLDLVGEQSLSNLSGAEHKTMRGVLMPMISAPSMRDQLLPKINEFMQSYLANWSGRILDLQDKSHEIVMLLTLKMIAGIEELNSFTNELKKELHHLAHGCSSLRINLPGTPYYKALQRENFEIRKGKHEDYKINWNDYKSMVFTRAESSLESHQYFMLFGGGVRLCAGKELAILEISMYLHYLVTKYRKEVGKKKIVNTPKTEAPNGIYFRFSEL